MARKTKLMQRVEKDHQRPLERLLPEMVNEVGLSGTAEALGVSGFTRNRPDGSVEVVAEGSDDELEQLAKRLREGPAFCSVTGVERESIVPRGDSSFHIR